MGCRGKTDVYWSLVEGPFTIAHFCTFFFLSSKLLIFEFMSRVHCYSAVQWLSALALSSRHFCDRIIFFVGEGARKHCLIWASGILPPKLRHIWGCLAFSFQICFQNQFLTSGSGQTENTQIRIFAYFQFDHFPKLKIDSESRFEKRMPIFQF